MSILPSDHVFISSANLLAQTVMKSPSISSEASFAWTLPPVYPAAAATATEVNSDTAMARLHSFLMALLLSVNVAG